MIRILRRSVVGDVQFVQLATGFRYEGGEIVDWIGSKGSLWYFKGAKARDDEGVEKL